MRRYQHQPHSDKRAVIQANLIPWCIVRLTASAKTVSCRRDAVNDSTNPFFVKHCGMLRQKKPSKWQGDVRVGDNNNSSLAARVRSDNSKSMTDCVRQCTRRRRDGLSPKD